MIRFRPRGGSRPRAFAGVLAVVLGAATSLLAVAPADAGHEQTGPIYNPETKSYFELRHDNKGIGYDAKGTLWRDAKRRAESLVFKDTRGRLAIVDNPQVYDFLRNNFKLTERAWIGLRFWCRYRKLQWIDGRIHAANAFSPWGRPWYRKEEFRCRHSPRMPYMAVVIRPHDEGFRWMAVTYQKSYYSYFVEYPTNGK